MEKKENNMLASNHLRDEIKNMETILQNEKVPVIDKVKIKCMQLVMKLLVDIRANQVAVMKHNNVKLNENLKEKEDKE